MKKGERITTEICPRCGNNTYEREIGVCEYCELTYELYGEREEIDG